MNANYITNLTPITNEAATGGVKTILEGSTAQLGYSPQLNTACGFYV